MSTRSIIAEPQGDGFRGRYCHSDGYPSHNGKTLFAIVQRDGVAKARQTLLHDSTYWSSISGEQEPPSYGIGDERFAHVPGYGTSGPGQDVEQDDWIEELGDWGTEWTYILGDTALFVTRGGDIAGTQVIPYHANLNADLYWQDLEETMS
jgi:hypothetical protein